MSKKKSKRTQAKAAKRKTAHAKRRNIKRQDPIARENARVHEQQTKMLRVTGGQADWGKYTHDVFRDKERHATRNRGSNDFID